MGRSQPYLSRRPHRVHTGSHIRSLFIPKHSLHGRNFGVVGMVTTLVNPWVETG